MSFTCMTHGWQHLLNPCPNCMQFSISIRSNGTGASIATNRELELLRQIEKLRAIALAADECLTLIDPKYEAGNKLSRLINEWKGE